MSQNAALCGNGLRNKGLTEIDLLNYREKKQSDCFILVYVDLLQKQKV